jgi:hypothetical protein
MFLLTVHNAPSILTPSEDYRGFDLVTIVTGVERLYRLSREVLGDMNSLRHYDFKLSFVGRQEGDLVILRIPYRETDYVLPSMVPLVPGVLVSGSGGSRLDGHLFKLIYRDRDMFDRGVPSLVDPNVVYTVGNRSLRFVFYRMYNGVPKFTGTLGSLALDSDPFPPVVPNPSERVTTLEVGGVIHYIMRLDSTPNIIYTVGEPEIPYDNVEEYVEGEYRFELGTRGNGYSGVPFEVSVVMSRVDGGMYSGGRPSIVLSEGIENVWFIREYVFGVRRGYVFGVVSEQGVEGVDIHASL